jgi:hypothetical protein
MAHPSTDAILEHFTHAHLPPDLAAVSRPFCDLAHDLARNYDGPEVTAGLRKLLEAKDCAVRAAVSAARKRRASAETPMAGDDPTP